MDKWKRLEEKLQGVFSSAKIKADGFEVTFYKRVDTKRQKLIVETYVDGWIDGKWTSVKDGKPVHPQGRFFFPMKKTFWPKKEYKSLKLVYGKEKADQMTTPQVFVVLPHWNSPRTLIAHLKREFPDLELVEEDAA